MAEKEEDILEETVDNEAEAETSKKGFSLSTALLIKVVIGLAILLIILAAVLFFLKSSAPDSASEDPAAEVTEQADSNGEDSELALPATPDKSDGETASANETAGIASSDKVLAQMLDLQEQISELKTENQTLTDTVEELTTENSDLKKQLEVFTKQLNSSEMPIDQLVNTRDLPRDYRRDDYANVPKFELKPKWGEFEKPGTTQQ